MARFLTDGPAPETDGVVGKGRNQVGGGRAPELCLGGSENGSFSARKPLDSLNDDAESTIATVQKLKLHHVEVVANDTAFATSNEQSPRAEILNSVSATECISGRDIAPSLNKVE